MPSLPHARKALPSAGLGSNPNFDLNRCANDYRGTKEMKTIKRALIVACAMVQQATSKAAQDQEIARATIWFTGFCYCAWDFVIVGLLIFAIRRLKNLNWDTIRSAGSNA
jgi:hypothetical protein